jgi:hypothetical protein
MESEEIQLSYKDRFLISPTGQWVVQHRNLLINIGTVILVLLVWGLIKTTRTPNMDGLKRANDDFIAWKAKIDDEELYQAFEKSLAKAPEIKRVLGGEIAQSLLIANRIDDAEEMAKELMNELRSIAPHYAQFSEISLLIARKRYQEALEKSVSLKEILSERTQLYAQNLIRIACLHQQLGNAAGELAAWRDLEQSGIAESASLGFSVKASEVPAVRLQSYVDERKTKLEQLIIR